MDSQYLGLYTVPIRVQARANTPSKSPPGTSKNAHKRLSRDTDKPEQKQVFSLQDPAVWEIMPVLFYPTIKGPTKMKKTALRAGALALVVALASGCVSQAQIDDIKATADRAAADAAAAASAAEAARASADRASQAAASAQSTADQALSAATEAQACCEANRESMERMFQKTMSK